ncbi:hypothetical protein EX895_005740 [Sporisorium graminicola]|uniref:Homeobox domain-containing protein n=1 Tax=Sporisorium graminicola TaxID=280036 RepID=A0A4U7KQW6_9BASI|nr:hypothetical protein EX895_005740 [Sporisorium graminicola]TKY85578.1 hypothetical protein EX895_005740 [Sporisorium graminicola]
MSHRPQRAAAVQANKATSAALAPARRRSDSQASIKTITTPQQHFKDEDRRYDGLCSPSMDIVMQRSSHQDLRRFDVGSVPSAAAAVHDEGRSYGGNAMQMYWPQDEPAVGGAGQPHASGGGAYDPQQLWGEPQHAQQHSLSHYDQVPNHGMFDLHYGYSAQSNSLGLKGESGLNVGLEGDLDLSGDHAQREQRCLAPSTSEAMALLDNLPFKASSSADDNDSYEDSTDSDLPPEKRKLSAAFRPRGRKKRNKCTPDQLRSLEAFFDKNRNPTGRVRLELSRKLRMPERSVQVWFQNRRAKVKTVERRGDTGSDTGRKKSCSIRLSERDALKSAAGSHGRMTRNQAAAAAAAEADQKPSVTAIPTSALCIGTWRRVSPLICFFSRRLQSLTWYLTSESIGFKLEIPWTSIRSAYFDGPSNPSIAERAEGVRVPLGHFVIDLERPPTFFMEVFRSAPVTAKNGVSEEPKVSWRQCEDFTEDHQAMTVSRHVLNGPYEELRSAVLALAQCNEVLQHLIQFHDESQRATGAIPTGSGSTADNFGLVNNVVRGPDPFALPPPPSMDACTALTGVDAYGNSLHMPMQPHPINMSASSSSSSSMTKSAAWHSFRTPMRGVEQPWEFDSPASVSTNLSEASLDSNRHTLGYSPYGVPTSIEASPRSGLGSSMDLNTLRIDAGRITSLGTAVAPGASGPHLPMMGDGGGGDLDSSRASFGGWEGRLSYDTPAGHQGGEQYSLAPSSLMETGQMSSHAMQMANGLNMQLHRADVERQDYGHSDDLEQATEPKVEASQLHESRGGSMYDCKDASSNDLLAEDSNSLLVSRRFSTTDASHADTAGQADEPDVSSRRADYKVAFSNALGPVSLTPSASNSSDGGGGDGRMMALEEDAFSGKTPTHRTCFSSALQMNQVNGEVHSEALSLGAPASGNDESDEQGAAQGRARSNTYRPSTHGGAIVEGLSSTVQISEGTRQGQSPILDTTLDSCSDSKRSGSADATGIAVDDYVEPAAQRDDKRQTRDEGKTFEALEGSPGLLSLGDGGVERDASPTSASSADSNERSAEDVHE